MPRAKTSPVAVSATSRADLLIAPVNPTATFRPPSRFYRSDVGLDLYSSDHVTVGGHATVLLRTNLAAVPPPGSFLLVIGRGSTFHSKGLIVSIGKIDPGYTGEIKVMVYNPRRKPCTVAEGERIAQIVIVPFQPVGKIRQLPSIAQLPQSEGGREMAAFGSTDQIEHEIEEEARLEEERSQRKKNMRRLVKQESSEDEEEQEETEDEVDDSEDDE